MIYIRASCWVRESIIIPFKPLYYTFITIFTPIYNSYTCIETLYILTSIHYTHTIHTSKHPEYAYIYALQPLKQPIKQVRWGR